MLKVIWVLVHGQKCFKNIHLQQSGAFHEVFLLIFILTFKLLVFLNKVVIDYEDGLISLASCLDWDIVGEGLGRVGVGSWSEGEWKIFQLLCLLHRDKGHDPLRLIPLKALRQVLLLLVHQFEISWVVNITLDSVCYFLVEGWSDFEVLHRLDTALRVLSRNLLETICEQDLPQHLSHATWVHALHKAVQFLRVLVACHRVKLVFILLPSSVVHVAEVVQEFTILGIINLPLKSLILTNDLGHDVGRNVGPVSCLREVMTSLIRWHLVRVDVQSFSFLGKLIW